MKLFRSVGFTSLSAILAVLAIWNNFRLVDADVYLAALVPIAHDSIVLASAPRLCGADSVSHRVFRGIDPVLAANSFEANVAGAAPASLSKLREYFAIADSRKLIAYERAGVSSGVLIRDGRSLVRLSRVGFNPDWTQAVFCAESSSARMLMHLRLEGGAWREVGVYGVSVS